MAFVSQVEPKTIDEALHDEHWLMAMQEELNQFERNEVWDLVPLPSDHPIIGTKWAFRNKLDDQESLKYPNHVYKIKKTLYGLKQAPRSWYDRLRKFLIENDYVKGKVDNTLFVKKFKQDTMYVQIYVDDIVFGSTNLSLCKEFSKTMQGEFEMSMMGELTFFLGLQIKQMSDGIFISQSKYCNELLKKFGMEGCKEVATLI
uniref:Copia protein n=1 Tax=Cajanus cajan TaxID=3821 RepID=A0A151S5Q4_CAJCA|nr:Copia protein [Cajanus cajan]